MDVKYCLHKMKSRKIVFRDSSQFIAGGGGEGEGLKDFFRGSHGFQGQWRQRSVKGMGGGGGTGHRKLISRGGS